MRKPRPFGNRGRNVIKCFHLSFPSLFSPVDYPHADKSAEVVAFVSASPDDEKPVDKKMRSCSFHRYT
jgi:hypothetical protein